MEAFQVLLPAAAVCSMQVLKAPAQLRLEPKVLEREPTVHYSPAIQAQPDSRRPQAHLA